jgi:hypothetical protein
LGARRQQLATGCRNRGRSQLYRPLGASSLVAPSSARRVLGATSSGCAVPNRSSGRSPYDAGQHIAALRTAGLVADAHGASSGLMAAVGPGRFGVSGATTLNRSNAWPTSPRRSLRRRCTPFWPCTKRRPARSSTSRCGCLDSRRGSQGSGSTTSTRSSAPRPRPLTRRCSRWRTPHTDAPTACRPTRRCRKPPSALCCNRAGRCTQGLEWSGTSSRCRSIAPPASAGRRRCRCNRWRCRLSSIHTPQHRARAGPDRGAGRARRARRTVEFTVRAAGIGIRYIDHREPFQRSTSGT